jgi:hypothetical protein
MLPLSDHLVSQRSNLFLIVFRRASLEVIMKDKWMNMGYEEEDLKPYVEPVQDWNDIKRIEILQVIIIISRENISTLVDAEIGGKMRIVGSKKIAIIFLENMLIENTMYQKIIFFISFDGWRVRTTLL